MLPACSNRPSPDFLMHSIQTMKTLGQNMAWLLKKVRN